MISTSKAIFIAILTFILGGIISGILLTSIGAHWIINPGSIPAPTTTPPGTETNADIYITSPFTKNISSPLTIQGEAHGTWFFEASFPITLLDENGKAIASTHAEALGDWMTTGTVPFTAILQFTPPSGQHEGILLFEKDNPSGLPENSGELRMPVTF